MEWQTGYMQPATNPVTKLRAEREKNFLFARQKISQRKLNNTVARTMICGESLGDKATGKTSHTLRKALFKSPGQTHYFHDLGLFEIIGNEGTQKILSNANGDGGISNTTRIVEENAMAT